MPITEAKKVLADAKMKPILQERINLLNADILLMSERIGNLKAKDSVNSQIIATYEAQLFVMKDQRKIFEAQLKDYEKKIRQQKRKTFFTGMAGIVTTAITFYIATK